MLRLTRRGFTLIELLVVIAIIALLVGILLPALGKARKASWMSISLSNIRQLNVGATTYREDFKGNYPLWGIYEPEYANRYVPEVKPDPNNFSGWCTWSFGGKNADAYWSSANRLYDIEAADRKLNAYVVPDAILYAPPGTQRLSPTDPTRVSTQVFVYRDPSEQVTYQRRDSNWTSAADPIGDPLSSYDDVGTSYHFNVNWWLQLEQQGILGRLGGHRTFTFGCDRLRLADSFTPSRMVWVNDQYVDVGANHERRDVRLKNGYDDINKGLMGFIDGHAAYHPIFPGGIANPKAFKNEFYTTVFEDLKPPP